MLPQRSSFLLQFGLNLIPLFGVAFLNWSAFALFYAYWLETFAISFLNAVRIVTAQQGHILFRIGTAIKFLLIQTGLLLFYLIFIIAFIGFNMSTTENRINFLNYFTLSDINFRIAMFSIFTVKLAELLLQYFLSREYKIAAPKQFYYFINGRIIMIHFVIVLGFFAFKFLNEAINNHAGVFVFTLVFVFAKMFIDYFSFKLQDKSTSSHVPYI